MASDTAGSHLQSWLPLSGFLRCQATRAERLTHQMLEDEVLQVSSPLRPSMPSLWVVSSF